jgi:hypothetical protein
VVLVGLALVAAQLGWTAALLAHSWFRQGDFLLLDRALWQGPGWDYLMRIDGGHLMPAGLAITWALARVSLYNWLLASGVILVLVAAASLAMLRMLTTLFAQPGDQQNPDGPAAPARRGILVPLAVYLFAPLSASAVAWLSVAVRVLPLQLAMFLAVDAHVRYLRRGRLRALIAAAVWLAVGMAAADQGALVPVLLFALTAAFLVPGPRRPEAGAGFPRRPEAGAGFRLRDSARRAAAGYWRAWAVYGAVTAAYCVIFFLRLAGSGVPVPGPGQASSLYRFAGTLLGTAALPGFAGGPWQWQPSGYGQASPPVALEVLSWLLVALVIAASCLLRPRAWRAWVLLLGWIVLADITPVAIRGFAGAVTALGQQTGYLANATGIFALCVGLAFMEVPAAGRSAVPEEAIAPAPSAEPARTPAAAAAQAAGAERARTPVAAPDTVPAGLVARAGPRAVRVVTIFAACCFAAGAIASQQAFASATMAAAARSYVATARAALAHAPRGAVIVDGVTPGSVMNAAFSPPGTADTAQVIGPLATRPGATRPGGPRPGAAARVRWIPALDGVYTAPMIFDAKGRLRPVTVVGLRSRAPHPAKSTPAKSNPDPTKNIGACWNVTASGTAIPLSGTLYRWPWTVRLAYTGPAGRLSLRFGPGRGSSVVLPAGAHLAYVPVTGSGDTISARFDASSGTASSRTGPLCVTRVVVGVATPDPAGQAIPREASRG